MDRFRKREKEARTRSDATASAGGGPELTQQQFTDEVDINTIVQRFGLTGTLPRSVTEGVYGDFSGISDYDSALQTIMRTQDRFLQLPAELRERFNNDPAELVRFASERSESELEAVFGVPGGGVEPQPPVVNNPVPAGDGQ